MRATLAFLCLALCSMIAFADDLTVTVRERQTGATIQDALVQIGPAPDDPFLGNIVYSNASGIAMLSDPALIPGLPLTVSAFGFAAITVFDCPVGAITVWCDPVIRGEWADTSFISGTVSNLPIANNDGFLDLAIVFSGASLEQLLTFNWELISPFTDPMSTPAGDVEIPENIDIPSQVELFFVTFQKEPYTRREETGSVIDLFCLGYRISLADLLAGEITNLDPTRATAVRDYSVSGDAVVNHTCTLNSIADLDVSVSGLPVAPLSGIISVGELTSSGRPNRFFPEHAAFINSDTSVTLERLPETGVLVDLATYTGVVYADTAGGLSFGGGALDWTPVTANDSRTFDAFYTPPEIQRIGNNFSWWGYQGAGTPDADYVFGTFSLDDRSAANQDTLAWEFVAPASEGVVTMPTLPPDAPHWPALPDPGITVNEDQLVWSCFIVSTPADLDEFLQSPLAAGELFSFRSGDAPKLLGPENLSISVSGTTDPVLTWSPEQFADGYSIHWFDAPWGPVMGEYYTQDTQYVDGNALPTTGSQRYYRLSSRGGISQSSWSESLGAMSWELDDGP